MADDGDYAKLPKKSQETFQQAQEAQVERKFPTRKAGVIPLPPGSRGPKSLYLKRKGDSFGFTLRHFIVYPPDSVTENDGRYEAVGALLTPMDTIFVKHVKDHSSAKQAGLQCGDRIVAVNNINVTDKSYAQVVQLIQNSPEYVHLLVVPKEEDVLQRFFSDAAYNPISNQDQVPELPSDKRSAQRFLTKTFQHHPGTFQVDATSWRTLRDPYGVYATSDASLTNRQFDDSDYTSDLYAEIRPHEPAAPERCRAQPQVPLYRKMGRRSSEGNVLDDFGDYNTKEPRYRDMVVSSKMKAMYNRNYLPDGASQGGSEMGVLNYPNSAGCRLSLDAGRRDSSSSLTSSYADGSKDSLSSYDSTSTLTGHETDDSAIMSRYRKSFQQKEEFLKMPARALDATLTQREFYGKPKKLERTMWPPNEFGFRQRPVESSIRQNSPSRNIKPIHHNFQRVKNDIETERDFALQTQGCITENITNQKDVNKASAAGVEDTKEDARVPALDHNTNIINGPAIEDVDDRRLHPIQVVHMRARQFESGKPLPEDDPSISDRTSFHKSELARISSKRIVPNVTERAQEYETRANEPRRDTSGTSVSTSTGSVPKRIQRDSRSLDSSGSNASTSSVTEVLGTKKLSGNVMVSSGSKYIHCPPPSEYGKPTADVSENEVHRLRVRSNSAESWVDTKDKGAKLLDQDTVEEERAVVADGELSPLIPEPVERLQVNPLVSITPAPSVVGQTKPMRPTYLDLDGPVRPARHIKPLHSSEVAGEDKPVVVKRRIKSTNIADDDRVTRRESYLKATEGSRMHFEFESDGEVSPQVLRSAHRRWRPPLFPGDIQQLRKLFEDAASSLGGSVSGNSSSTASLDREKIVEKDEGVIKEGLLHCKITEIDGKRAGDRSWKLVWAKLVGSKLLLFKDRNHQSPIGTSDVENALSSSVDIRGGDVRVAEDYTKKKHVLRVTSLNPCRSELLLQANNSEELADWVKVLKQQVGADPEEKPKQQAVPQTVPASTSVLVQGVHLSPQPNKAKSQNSRNRSPTGQSPVSKTRKPSQPPEQGATSPKSKTWRGRMARHIKRIQQGASSPSSPTAPEGSTFGIPLDQCLPSLQNQYVPRFVEVCTDIVDDRGLNMVGIYRVPGNNASITALTDEVNKNYDDVPQEDPKWNDVHVVGSLLKSYLRKMPDSLVTNDFYPHFIKADKIEDPQQRMNELKRLVKSLPPHNYHTLRHIILHLKRIVDNCDVNKMEAKNVAIVFGPTIVRPEEETMESMVHNMTHQCKIVETLLTYAEWFFLDSKDIALNIPITSETQEEADAAINQQALLENIHKYEALNTHKEKNGALFTSIISAAQRKVKRKPKQLTISLHDTKEDLSSPTGTNSLPSLQFSPSDLKTNATPDSARVNIPTTVTEIEKSNKPNKNPWFNYQTDEEEFHKRIANFENETKAMLQMPRSLEISVNNIANRPTSLSTSVGNVHQKTRLSVQSPDPLLTKTQSACSVFTRSTKNANNRNSLSSVDNTYSVQYGTKSADGRGGNVRCVRYSSGVQYGGENIDRGLNANNEYFKGDRDKNVRFVLRRGSSAENLNSSTTDVNANGSMKKVKYETEGEAYQRPTGSLDSLNKLPTDDDGDLVTTMTKLMDQKFKEDFKPTSLLTGDGLPYVDESPEKLPRERTSSVNKENIPQPSDLYRNPCLHKNPADPSKQKGEEVKNKEKASEKEKDEDSTIAPNVPDNERRISTHKLTLMSKNTNTINSPPPPPPNSKLRRSESLNKPEGTVTIKIKRSESLNKTGDKLKRSDSLTKTEKTESNINKKRELTSVRKSKEFGKLKRKNGMPDRSIKRRHTVGGTKDPDKITWLDKYQEEVNSKENKEKNIRTSSPDLSSTRRERFLFEINLFGPDNMVVALRQHLIGARPQSFPESSVFKVPLESHV